MRFGTIVQAIIWLMMLLFFSIMVFTFGFEAIGLRQLFTLCCHVVLFYAFYSWLVPAYYETRRHRPLAFYSVAVFICIGTARYFIDTRLVNAVNIPFYKFLNRPGSIIAFILISQLIVFTVASLLRLSVRRIEVEKKLYTAETLQANAELKFLKAQINPHFLFNTINNLYAMAVVQHRGTADGILKLSGLLRYLVYDTGQAKVTLAQETEAMREYIALYQLKYPAALPVSTHLRANEALLIEPLILLTLVENAFKHSGMGEQPGAFIRIQTVQQGDWLQVAIVNSLAQEPIAATDASGIGLENLQKRLALNYKDAHELTITRDAAQFSVFLKIPATL
jgi:hypothetical protein